MSRMRIAYLAWGSLIREPDCLKIRGPFKRNGPELPVEFARISDNGRVTLVLHPNAKPVPTFSTGADHDNLPDTIDNLRLREGPERCKERARAEWVAAAELSGKTHGTVDPVDPKNIKRWLRTSGYDAAVWTALPPRLSSKYGSIKSLTVQGVVDYLQSAPPEVQERAKEYFQCVPKEIQTDLRSGIEQRMGW